MNKFYDCQGEEFFSVTLIRSGTFETSGEIADMVAKHGVSIVYDYPSKDYV